MQPVPDWSTFHNNPNSLNIRSGVFWQELEQQFEVYLLNGNEQLFSKPFDTLQQALSFLNNSEIVMNGNKISMQIRISSLNNGTNVI